MRSKYPFHPPLIITNFIQTNQSNAGFGMPLVLGLGLVMIIVSTSITLRSQSDRTSTNLHKETSRALGISEAGVLRVQSFLDRHKFLANHNLDTWTDTLKTLPAEQINCNLINFPLAKQQTEVFKNHTWIDLDPSDRQKGRYQVIDYQYQSGIGKLTIAGEINPYLSTNHPSNSTVTVSMPVASEDAKIKPPGLWAQTFKLNPQQKISGDIRAIACPNLASSSPDGITGLDRQNITKVDDKPIGKIIADPFTSIPKVKIAPNNATLLPAITNSIQLPRPGSSDVPDDRGEYHYLVDVDSKSGYSVKLTDKDSIQINIPTNRRINLYLKGNIDLSGSQTINVNVTNPNLRIYGGDRTLKFTINDNASITAFIHAPLAAAQSMTRIAKDRLHPNITGAIWVKSWDSTTSSSKIPIIPAGNWADFGINKLEQPSQISPISSWQRIENKK